MTGKPRGRSGGRKSEWSRPTKMMRLPIDFEARIREFARRLDTGEEIVSETISKFDLQQAMNQLAMTVPPGDRRAALRLFKKLLSAL
jgi:hypothetical protein